ncbi:MAG: S9 family peptidase [Novosphingobium sp.]|nr:S9 family peptidase [Novosphingobium sp.]
MTPVVASAAPPLEIYGKLPAIEAAAISPSGDHVAVIARLAEERKLIVFDNTKKLVLQAPLGNAKIRNLSWAGDAAVLIDKSSTDHLEMGFTTDKAELLATIVVPLTGAKPWVVFADDRMITGGVTGSYGVIEKQGKWFGYFGGITFDKGSAEPGDGYLTTTAPVLYEVDLQTGRDHKIAPRTDGKFRRWLVGPDGTVSATFDSTDGGNWSIRNSAGQKIASGANPSGDVGLVGFGSVAGTIIYSDRRENDTDDHWYQVPLAGGTAQEILKNVKIKDTIFDRRKRTLAGYEIDGDFPTYYLFDARQQKIVTATQKAFPGAAMHLVDWNDTFDRLIVMTEGAADPQSWWLVDIKTGKAEQLGDSYALQPQDIAPVQMVHYAAADGSDIAAVLTLPPGRAARNLPVVVLPHGGPTARDYPRFDWWAQAFASRGYAVLQPNFRGSSGYGVEFELAGNGEWGRKMQTDISDGLAYLAKQGIVDPRRACVMGASYGGYAALAGVTLQHGVYRCAVAVAGVSDLSKFAANELKESDYSKMSRRALKTELGSGRDLTAVSPIRFAATVAAPVLLIHGKDDTVVPFNQSSDMAAALTAGGKDVELLTLPHEDHWLSQSDTRLMMLQSALAFVQKHNPADPAQ